MCPRLPPAPVCCWVLLDYGLAVQICPFLWGLGTAMYDMFILRKTPEQLQASYRLPKVLVLLITAGLLTLTAHVNQSTF